MKYVLNVLFWAILIVPFAILIFYWPLFLVLYIAAGAAALTIYLKDFGKEAELAPAIAAFCLPHVYFILRFCIDI